MKDTTDALVMCGEVFVKLLESAGSLPRGTYVMHSKL